MCDLSLNFWNWWTVVVRRANLGIGTTQRSKFSKFDLTPQFHLFFWLKNTPYFINFRFRNDGNYRHMVFTPSEVAPLSSFLQSIKKSLIFRPSEPKGPTNFGCLILKLHTLNYHTARGPCFVWLILKKFISVQVCKLKNSNLPFIHYE